MSAFNFKRVRVCMNYNTIRELLRTKNVFEYAATRKMCRTQRRQRSVQISHRSQFGLFIGVVGKDACGV